LPPYRLFTASLPWYLSFVCIVLYYLPYCLAISFVLSLLPLPYLSPACPLPLYYLSIASSLHCRTGATRQRKTGVLVPLMAVGLEADAGFHSTHPCAFKTTRFNPS
jgi:hypothetical protein